MTITIHENGVDRQATKDEIDEIAQRQKAESLLQAEHKAIAAEKAKAKAVILKRLGITADEAALLLS